MLAQAYLIRHGETEWSRSGRHTSRTDVPLTERGRIQARRLGERLAGTQFTAVLSSPRVRATLTCELAGLGGLLHREEDLREWDYGDYEGQRTVDIQAQRPGWNLFRDGCPGGEALEEVCARADGLIRRIRAQGGRVALFSHGHFLRILAVRWLALPGIEGRRLLLAPATLSILGYEHDNPEEPALVLWNDDRHLNRDLLGT